jgi:hypothetical protein
MNLKETIKGGIFLGLAPLILLYIGNLYRFGGFSPAFAMLLAVAIPGVGVLLLSGFRLMGSVPGWISMLLCLVVAYLATADAGTAVLVWAACCGAPIAVSLFWPNFPRLRPLVMGALPLAGGIWLGGGLLYAKLHLGGWDLSAITRKISEGFLAMLDQMEQIYGQIYTEGIPQEFHEMLALLREQHQIFGFSAICLAANLLMGSFFGSIWAADRIASPGPDQRWLGSWAVLFPSKGISWLFALAYFSVPFLADPIRQTMTGVLNLLGFFYVFAALYVFLQFLRKKNWPKPAQFLVIFTGFVLAFFSVGGLVLAPYSLLLVAGLVFCTSRHLTKKIL